MVPLAVLRVICRMRMARYPRTIPREPLIATPAVRYPSKVLVRIARRYRCRGRASARRSRSGTCGHGQQVLALIEQRGELSAAHPIRVHPAKHDRCLFSGDRQVGPERPIRVTLERTHLLGPLNGLTVQVILRHIRETRSCHCNSSQSNQADHGQDQPTLIPSPRASSAADRSPLFPVSPGLLPFSSSAGRQGSPPRPTGSG